MIAKLNALHCQVGPSFSLRMSAQVDTRSCLTHFDEWRCQSQPAVVSVVYVNIALAGNFHPNIAFEMMGRIRGDHRCQTQRGMAHI